MNQTGPVATIDSHEHLETTVAIIGSGFSGLGMAIQLRKRGRDDFLILEKSHDVGGTWRDNTYPGCGCDVPTAVYSYSFEQNPYLVQDVVFAARDPGIPADESPTSTTYAARRCSALRSSQPPGMTAASRWRLRSADGRTITAQFLVIGHRPDALCQTFRTSSGIESFTGPAFHSARWDHSVDLTGKKVAVIGTGASAIQFVPIIAEHVEQLQLYQRTPPWVLTRLRPDHPQVTSDAFRQGAAVPASSSAHITIGSRSR